MNLFFLLQECLLFSVLLQFHFDVEGGKQHVAKPKHFGEETVRCPTNAPTNLSFR